MRGELHHKQNVLIPNEIRKQHDIDTAIPIPDGEYETTFKNKTFVFSIKDNKIISSTQIHKETP